MSAFLLAIFGTLIGIVIGPYVLWIGLQEGRYNHAMPVGVVLAIVGIGMLCVSYIRITGVCR